MKNILLQHWTGKLPELVKYSVENMKKYAKKCGADYRLLEGNGFRPWLATPCQKLWMLDEEFDEYDVVVMVDPDMFTRKGMEENIFTDVTGIGMYTEFQANLFIKLQQQYPLLTDKNFPYWGGAIYRLEREHRVEMRKYLNDAEMTAHSGNFNDEGIMHRCAVSADYKEKRYFDRQQWNYSSFEETVDEANIMHRLACHARIPMQKLPGGFKWCHCSYREGIEDSAMIHIRTKTTPTGNKKPKLDNYYTLVKRGLI